MRLHRRYLLAAALLGVLLAALPSVASSEISSTGEVEAVNEPGVGIYGERHHWAPPQVAVTANGVVTFSNPTTVVHGVEWIGAKPTTCTSGVPVGTTPAASAAKWSGTCTFTQPGTYTFYCTVHGPEMTGKITVVGTPTATTALPSEVTQTGAKLNGVVNPQGEATSYYFEYGTTSGFGQKLPLTAQSVGSDFTAHHLSVSLKGLSPNTEYHAELVASYGTSSTVLGGEQVFSTPAVSAPIVSTGQASSVTQTGVTLGGLVSPEGQETSYRFEYGLSTSYGNLTPIELTGPEGTSHAALASVTDLSPATVYHFRLIAENASGPVEGEDRTFTTASPSPPPPPPPPPPATTTTTPTPAITPPPSVPIKTNLSETPPGPLFVGAPALRSSQRGASVRGSVKIAEAGTGGRLEVDLLAKSASLAKTQRSGSGSVRVGRFLRSSLSAGKLSFSVGLTAAAKRTLARHHRLAVSVKIILTPTKGEAVVVVRNVVLRA